MIIVIKVTHWARKFNKIKVFGVTVKLFGGLERKDICSGRVIIYMSENIIIFKCEERKLYYECKIVQLLTRRRETRHKKSC